MAQATSVAEIFELMPSRFNAQAAHGVNATYQFELTGDNGGTYHVKIANGACEVAQGPVEGLTTQVRRDLREKVFGS